MTMPRFLCFALLAVAALAACAEDVPGSEIAPWQAGTLDYALLTHFHGDHMGDVAEKTPLARSGTYRLTGLTQVGESLRIGTMLDRGWPDYNFPAPLDNATVKNYRASLKWQAENRGMKVERFARGRNDQVVLRRDPKKYPDFVEQLASDRGHIVLRVSPGGRDFRVVIVDDSSENHRVTRVFGPYPCQ